MSMHLARGLTTTSTKKRTQKITKAMQQELESGWRDRNVWLRGISLPKETFEQYLEWVYGNGKKAKTKAKSSSATSTTPTAKIFNGVQPIIEKVLAVSDVHGNRESAHETCNKYAVPERTNLWVTGACSSKPSPTYTGTKIIGIGTMHKSNMVPIFSDEEAKDISRMRR